MRENVFAIVGAMQKNENRTGTKRVRWGVTAALLLVAGVSAIVLFPRGLRGPERSAGEFLELMMQTPVDVERLRNAAHITTADDPRTLLQGLSTGVTLSFLQARQAQGVSQDISVIARQQPAPQRYTVTLRVSDTALAEPASRDFIVQLEQIADGDWRVVSIRAAD
jgi:hypothetical protein